MKKVIILLICCLVLFGCQKEDTSNKTAMDNVVVEEIGIVKSDLGEECLLLKATNNNTEDITVFSTVVLYDESKNELASETNYVNLYSNQSNYYIVEISGENKYSSYEVKNEVNTDLYKDYKKIYNKVKLEKTSSADKDIVSFKVDNNSNKTVSTKVLGLFYKNNKIIAASIGECEDIEKNKTCNDAVYIPVKSMEDYNIIDYDKAELSLMNVIYSN